MNTRELIKNEIDQLQENYLDFVYRIIRALMPSTAKTPMPRKEGVADDSWEEFIRSTYGVFRDEPLERASQGTLEIRESFE